MEEFDLVIGEAVEQPVGAEDNGIEHGGKAVVGVAQAGRAGERLRAVAETVCELKRHASAESLFDMRGQGEEFGIERGCKVDAAPMAVSQMKCNTPVHLRLRGQSLG